MMRLLIYLLVFGIVLYLLSRFGKSGEFSAEKKPAPAKSRFWFKSKSDPREAWMQVYETDSMEEARRLQARLQEEEIECVVYEQGKKDIHGNVLKGVGLAVPKTAGAHSQGVIARMMS